jgi:hypothetical protein
MRVLWKWINELFFGGDFRDVIFNWDKDMNMNNTGQATSSKPPRRTWKITMNPNHIASDIGPYKVLATLSTLIHEVVHIFLDKYSCHHCETFYENQQAIWHSSPFQLVAAKLEEVVPRLLSIPIKLGRFYSFLHGWPHIYTLPSRHDMAVYRFSNVRLWSNEDADLKELIAATARLHKYQPWRIPNGRRWDREPLMDGDVFRVVPEIYHIREEDRTVRASHATGQIGDEYGEIRGPVIWSYDTRLDTGIGQGGAKVRIVKGNVEDADRNEGGGADGKRYRRRRSL